jgi:hypothetical protein
VTREENEPSIPVAAFCSEDHDSSGLVPVFLVGEWGEPGRSEPFFFLAVWLEDERVRLASGWNISHRCGLDSFVKTGVRSPSSGVEWVPCGRVHW